MKTRKTGQSGLSLVELLAVLAIMGLSLGMTALYLKPAEAPLQTGAVLLEGYFRQARFKAMANTSAYRIKPGMNGLLRSEYANSCSDTTWTPSNSLNLTLPEGVNMTEIDWIVCFSARGVSSDNVVVTLTHPEYGTKQVEVLLGGTTQVL